MSHGTFLAATLILIRETAGQPLEMLIAERAPGLTAFGGALVFPGGRIDPADERLAERFDCPLAAAKIAAIRETVEETAIAAGIAPAPSPQDARRIQAGLHSGEDFAALLDGLQLGLALEALTPFARWEPPPGIRRRFDTYFFVARAPAGQWQPAVQESECVDAHWLTLAQVEARAVAGSGQLLFPTRCNLQRIGRHASFAAVLDDAAAHPVETVHPCIEERDGERWLVIPERHGYPVNETRMAR